MRKWNIFAVKNILHPTYRQKLWVLNPIKLQEELLQNHKIPSGSYVCDLGSGQGLTSVFLAKEYGFVVFAVDLWSEPKENEEFFKKMGLSSAQIKSVKADANELKFEKEFFDAVVSTDSYNYFGRDPIYLDEKLLPFVKKGGFVYITVPGMKKDCHEKLPEELLLSWTPEELDYIHDITYWSNIISHCKKADLISIYEMESNSEVWSDWIKQNNEYAINDRKAIEAGGGDYLNFIAIILQKINSLEPNTIICVLICLPIDINNFIFEGNDLKIEEYKKIRN